LEFLLIEEFEELKKDFKSNFVDGAGAVEIDKQFHYTYIPEFILVHIDRETVPA
jgi:hypothetical protein